MTDERPVHSVDVFGYGVRYSCPRCDAELDQNLDSGGYVTCHECEQVYEVDVMLTKR